MHTRSVTKGRRKVSYRGIKTTGLDNLRIPATQHKSVNTGLYKDELGGALGSPTKKRVACQRKTWSTAECKELRKRREEGQSFSDLSTVRVLLLSSNDEILLFIDISLALWRVCCRCDSTVLEGDMFGR